MSCELVMMSGEMQVGDADDEERKRGRRQRSE